jgi:transposase
MLHVMAIAAKDLPDDVSVLKAMLVEAHRLVDDRDGEIANLKLTIAKLQRDRFGASSERGRKLLDQLELQLAELEEGVAQDKVNFALATGQLDEEDEQRRPARRSLPAHLPRERLVHEAPCTCSKCGGKRLRKLGEDVTETLDYVPGTWKVVQHVREKFTCRDCESITQAPTPNHPIARGRAGPNLLAHLLFSKYRAHMPLNRQCAIYRDEGVDLDVSTLADWVGACVATLQPLVDRIEKHVLSSERIHADDTTVPVLAKGKCRTGRLWTYVRDDKPFGGEAAPAVLFYYSADRGGEHPERHLESYSGLMQADAYSGYNGLYTEGRQPGEIVEAACWAHGRRKFFEIAELKNVRRDGGERIGSPVAIEAVRRIDELFAIEREINGKPLDERIAVRQERSKPLIDDLEIWLKGERRKLSSKHRLAKAIDYLLKRWEAFTRFLDDGRICLSNNAAERAIRGIAVGRKNWTFAGSDSGGRRAAAIYSLIETAKLNNIDIKAWLADVLARIADHPMHRIDELLPWNWKAAPADHYRAA